MGVNLLQAQAVTASDPDSSTEFAPLSVSEKYEKAFLLSLKLLQEHHYQDAQLEGLSADVFDDYLNALDPAHTYFLQSDIEEFSANRDHFLTPINTQRIRTAFDMFERYRKRADAMNQWTLRRLEQPFDLNTDKEVYIPPFHQENNREWPKTLEDATAYQEERLTDQIIRQILSDKSEEEAVETLTKRYKSANKRLGQTTSDDVFDIFLNVITTRFDPHTNYLSPRVSEDFDINMRLSLEGIGAVLSVDDEKVTIRELTPGGPAAKSGKLHIRDQIIGVAQGEDGEMVDIVGWRLDKAVKLIRGKKGSFVRLLIEPVKSSGGAKEVIIKREEIKLEDQGAQAYVEEVEEQGIKKRIGVIRLPSFYMDFNAAQLGKKDFRSTSKDVERLLLELQDNGVDGIIVDLRGNGGGSLYEAVQTVGLFIDQGPVVSVSNTDGSVREEVDETPGAVYEGPLAVMIDHYSASASEIFAAAIQDYQRGIVIGSNTFGKGTVQTMIDLNRFVSKNSTALGKLKFTIAMFHRVNGDSTQLKGVAPDIAMPEGLGLDVVGEQSEKHAMKWKHVRPSEFTPAGNITPEVLAEVEERHVKRMANDPALSRYQEYVRKVTAENDKSMWSLNLEKRQQEYQDWERYSDAYEAAQRDSVPSLEADAKRKSDIEKRNEYAKDENDKEQFVPDVALYEALNIFYDFLVMLQAHATPKAA
ncbi:carboxy terminal-processing peptidase [Cardiobacteriaceae bacterium TAE3-ERU3]|nr:carboxy terminal-processing peptidase [Cardiobacteriaceae bacterium TAE3-ERU3]